MGGLRVPGLEQGRPDGASGHSVAQLARPERRVHLPFGDCACGCDVALHVLGLRPGGNSGAVAMLNLFFKGHPIRKDVGIYRMGLTIVILTCTMVMPVYFPEHGGMFFKAGALGSYDPQIIKPPEGYRGA